MTMALELRVQGIMVRKPLRFYMSLYVVYLTPPNVAITPIPAQAAQKTTHRSHVLKRKRLFLIRKPGAPNTEVFLGNTEADVTHVHRQDL